MIASRAYSQQYIHTRVPRPQVRDDDHVAKLKLNITPFEGRYNSDAYLT